MTTAAVTADQSIDIVVCETCRRAPDEDLRGRTSGRALAEAVERALAADPVPGVQVTTTRCLMACSRSCAVALRGAGRMSYVLGDLSDEVGGEGAGTVEALIAYVRAYAASVDGVVPFRAWPDGIKGRFVARIPPAG